eukprot:TRINITY_DN5188_c0_g1_i1.p1 TRINITY_DN5188_c0_g1~~TRINITY_DN5188_c0_g1_i1.p1  ORF type:complete len:831 (+),score=142.12 TRINITY_DN5188_c0_g1_i1:157-2493(+)
MAAEEDNQEDEWELTPHKYASQVIDTLAKFLPTAKIFPNVMKYVDEYSKSNNPFQRRAAASALLVMAGGCHEHMASNLETLLPYLFNALNDPNTLVRGVGVLTLGQFSEHLQPEILTYADQILPQIFQKMEENSPDMQERACYALVSFVQSLEGGVLPYIESLMNKLLHLLKFGKKQLREMSISAISAVATSSKKKFLPYYEVTINLMKEMMLITNLEQILLRCRATECAGVIAVAVGKEIFKDVLPFFMDQACKGLTIEDKGESDLREYTYSFFAHIAEILGYDFATYLPVVIPLVLEGMDSTSGIYENVPPEERGLQALLEDDEQDKQNTDGDDIEEELEQIDLNDVKYTVGSSFLDEKLQALHALSIFALACGPHIIPFVQRCLQSLEILIRYIHPDIRRGALAPLESFMIACHIAYPPEQKWIPNHPPDQPPNVVTKGTQELSNTIVPLFIFVFEGDEERRVVAKAQDCLINVIKLIGPGVIFPHMDSLKSSLLSLIKSKAPCQEGDDSDDEDEENEVESEIAQLFTSTTVFIADLSKVFGNYFLNYFELIEELLRYHLNPSSVPGFREDVIACCAEVCRALGPHIHYKLDILAAAAIAGLKDEYEPVRCNSAYLTGTLCEYGGEKVLQYYPQFLELLSHLFNKNSIPGTIDNASGALGRMITAYPMAVPLQQVLPVLIDSLPLRVDFQESHSTYGALISLFYKSNEAIVPFIPRIVVLFSDLVTDQNVPSDVQAEMTKVLKVLISQYGNQLNQQIGGALSPKQKDNLNKIIQS